MSSPENEEDLPVAAYGFDYKHTNADRINPFVENELSHIDPITSESWKHADVEDCRKLVRKQDAEEAIREARRQERQKILNSVHELEAQIKADISQEEVEQS